MIKLLTTTADLCEQIATVDMECPIQKGKTTITKDVEMPSQIPPVCLPCDRSESRLLTLDRENILFLQMFTLLMMCILPA